MKRYMKNVSHYMTYVHIRRPSRFFSCMLKTWEGQGKRLVEVAKQGKESAWWLSCTCSVTWCVQCVQVLQTPPGNLSNWPKYLTCACIHPGQCEQQELGWCKKIFVKVINVNGFKAGWPETRMQRLIVLYSAQMSCSEFIHDNYDDYVGLKKFI